MKELLPAQQPGQAGGDIITGSIVTSPKLLLNICRVIDMYLNTKIMQMSIQISRTEM
jgi:hypothetical protein